MDGACAVATEMNHTLLGFIGMKLVWFASLLGIRVDGRVLDRFT